MATSSGVQKNAYRKPMDAANNLYLLLDKMGMDFRQRMVVMDAVRYLHDMEQITHQYDDVCERLVAISRRAKRSEQMEIWELRQVLSDVKKIAGVDGE